LSEQKKKTQSLKFAHTSFLGENLKFKLALDFSKSILWQHHLEEKLGKSH